LLSGEPLVCWQNEPLVNRPSTILLFGLGKPGMLGLICAGMVHDESKSLTQVKLFFPYSSVSSGYFVTCVGFLCTIWI